MAWFAVDDGFWGHPKRLACPAAAIGLWAVAGSWAAQQLTDGFIPRHVLPVLGGKPKDAAALVAAGLWETEDGGWRFHEWDERNPTAAEVLADRAEKHEAKVRAGRAGGLASGARRRQTGSGGPSRTEADREQTRSRHEAEPEQGANGLLKQNEAPSPPLPSQPLPVVQREEEVEVALGLARADVERVVRQLQDRQRPA